MLRKGKLSGLRTALGRRVRHLGGATQSDVNRLQAQLHTHQAQLHTHQAQLETQVPRLDWLAERVDALEKRERWHTREVEDLKNRAAIEAVSRFIRHAPVLERPLVSVVVPTLARPERLERAIASVRAQRYQNWELLVVEDGGDQSSRAVVDAIADQRISWSRIARGGAAAARNHALRSAHGELVAYLDDDNLMDPDWLHAVVWAFEQRPELDVVYGAWVVDDHLRLDQTAAGALPSMFFRPWDRELLHSGNLADVSAISHRRTLPGAWFDERLQMLEDWDLLVRLTEAKDALALPVIACYYTTDAPNRNSSGPTVAHERAIVSERARGGGKLSRTPLPQTQAIVYRDLGQPALGRLGNQLWQIAGTLGIAAAFGKQACFPEWPYRRHFSIPDQHFVKPPLYCEDAAHFVPHIGREHRPYLQDPTLWREIEPTIRAYFAPSASARADLEARFGAFLRLPAKTAVHIRRGDYLPQPEYFPVQPEAYLRAALARVPGTNVVIFSDDIPWCRANLSWAEPAMLMTDNTDYEDLLLMARCEHHIIANSSFSWWGAFLSDNPSPMFPTHWWGPRFDELFPGADPTPMFLEGWIRIDA